MLLQQLIHEIAMLKPFRQVRHSDVLNWNNAKMVGIITIQSFEWCDLDGRVVACIIPIFRQGEPRGPLGRAGMDKATQISFQALIHMLCLAIGLGMIS